jgi:hypothetical protein
MLDAIQQFVDENPSFNKKEFIKFVEGTFDLVFSAKRKGKLPPLKAGPGGAIPGYKLHPEVERDGLAVESKPKRLPTAYQTFQKVQQVKVKSANPSMKPTEVMKEVARRWNLQKAGVDEAEWGVAADE